MANKNIGILSLMAQADNKSVIQAVNSMDKTFQSEVNGKFNAIGDEIGKQAEDALKILNRTTLKDVKVTQPVSDFFLNILRSTSADDALNYITDFTNRMEALHSVVKESKFNDLLNPLSENQISKLLPEVDEIAKLKQNIVNRTANLAEYRKQIIDANPAQTTPTKALKPYVTKKSGYTVDNNISPELSDFVSSNIDKSSEDINKKIQQYQLLLNVFEKLNLEKKHMSEGSEELVGYNNQLQYVYNQILKKEKAIPKLKEFRESLAQNDSKYDFFGRDLEYYKKNTRDAADEYIKKQNRIDNSTITDIRGKLIDKAFQFNESSVARINAKREKAGLNNVAMQSNMNDSSDSDNSGTDTVAELTKSQQRIADILKMDYDTAYKKMREIHEKLVKDADYEPAKKEREDFFALYDRLKTEAPDTNMFISDGKDRIGLNDTYDMMSATYPTLKEKQLADIQKVKDVLSQTNTEINVTNSELNVTDEQLSNIKNKISDIRKLSNEDLLKKVQDSSDNIRLAIGNGKDVNEDELREFITLRERYNELLESDEVGESYKNSQSSIDRTFNKIIEQHNADYEAIINHQKELIQEIEQITPPEVSTNDIKEDSINEPPKESLKEKTSTPQNNQSELRDLYSKLQKSMMDIVFKERSPQGVGEDDIRDFITSREHFNELLQSSDVGENYKDKKSKIDDFFKRITEQYNIDYEKIISQQEELLEETKQLSTSEDFKEASKEKPKEVIKEEPKEAIKEETLNVPNESSDVSSEATSFEGLKTAITQVTSAVDKKTQAFKEEEQVVTGTVQREINSLDVLIGTLVTIQEHIEKIKASATELQNINTGNVSSQFQTTTTENSSNNNQEKLQNDLKTTQSNAETLNQTLKEIKENSTISIKIEAPEEVTSKLITQLEALKKILDNDWLSKVQELSKLKELKNLGITDKALDKFKNLKTGLDGIVKSFNKINDGGFAFLDNLTILAQQGEALKDLTTLLKTSQSQLTNARNTVNNNKNFINEDVYDNNSEQWLKDNVDALSNNSKYIGVLDAEISRASNGMVKFTANVKNAKNEWQKLSGTVKADGSLTNISLKNIQGKQANNLDNVLNGNSNTSQLSNKEDILKDIEKSLKMIYDYRVKIASTNDTDALNDLNSKLSSEQQQYKQLVDNYKTNYSVHPNDLDDDFRNVVKPVKVQGRKNIRVASADAILDKITKQQAEVSKLKSLESSIKNEGDNTFDDYLQDQENKLNELIKKYKQYGDVVQDVQQKIENAKVNGSNEGTSQADTLRANYESVNKIHGELQNGNQQGFLEKYYKSASDAVDSLIGKQQQGEEITKKELQNVQSLYNEYKKIANAGTPLADNIRGKVNADSYILNNAKQQGTIISQGEFKETDISKGLATTIIKIRNAKGEIRDLQYTWHDGMISMADNTKKVQTSLVGVPKIMDALSKKSKELITYWTANYINPYKIIEMIQKGVNIVKELDTALVDLRKTTTMSSTDLKDFYSDANEAAKEYGVTTKQIIDQASSWSRLGYSDKNSATEMAKLSSQFATISPGMDIDKATTGLVSTMKAFDVQVDDVKDGIMSKINSVGNAFATSNDEIIDGLERSASAMASTGASLEDTIAIFTGGQEIVQNAESVGSAMKTFSMRIRGMDEEGEALDELSNVKGDVYELTNGKVSIMKDENTYRSIYDILKDIAGVWDDITDKNKAKLLEKLFAKTRANTGAAILQNWDQVEKAVKTMEDSAGSADNEMSIAADSIEFKLNKLSQTWVSFAQDTLSQNSLKGTISLLTGLSQTLTGILGVIQNITSLGGILPSGGLLGDLGIASGFVMNKMGIGKRTVSVVMYCAHPSKIMYNVT